MHEYLLPARTYSSIHLAFYSGLCRGAGAEEDDRGQRHGVARIEPMTPSWRKLRETCAPRRNIASESQATEYARIPSGPNSQSPFRTRPAEADAHREKSSCWLLRRGLAPRDKARSAWER